MVKKISISKSKSKNIDGTKPELHLPLERRALDSRILITGRHLTFLWLGKVYLGNPYLNKSFYGSFQILYYW